MIKSTRILSNPILTLVLIIPFATTAVMIMSAALLACATYYGVSESSSNNIITIAMFGYAIGPIIYGPIANRLGKKKTLGIGFFIALSGIMICIISFYIGSFLLLLIGRLITTLGAVSGMVIGFAMVARCHSPEEARKILSMLIILAFAIMPSLAIALGGYISSHYGFVYCLYFLAIYTLINFTSVFFLSCTKDATSSTVDATSSAASDSISSYLFLIKNKTYLSYISLTGIAVAAVYIYATIAPVIVINQLKLSTEAVGYYSFIPYIGYVMALYLSGKFSHRWAYKKIIITGLCFATVGSLIILIASITRNLGTDIFFTGACIIFFGLAPIIPNSIILATNSYQDKNSAASLGSFLFMTIAAILTWIASFIPLMRVLLIL